jgi:hypothetical protein
MPNLAFYPAFFSATASPMTSKPFLCQKSMCVSLGVVVQ